MYDGQILADVGVDFSLSSPAICIIPADEELDISKCHFVNIQGTKKYSGDYIHPNGLTINIDRLPNLKTFESREERLNYLRGWFDISLPYHIRNFYIEGYSMGSVGQISTICEIGGIIRNLVFDSYGCDIIEFPPTTIKKVFAGVGNASKEEMIDTFVQRTNLDLSEVIGNDIDYYAGLITDLTDSFAVLYTGRNQHLIEETTKKKGKK